jgi:signal transduction histidine kinase
MGKHFESLYVKGVKTLMVAPLVIGEQNLGFLELHFGILKRISPDELELAQAMVNHATLALQLNRLTRRAEQLAVTEERNRLARDIHDTLAQSFAGVVLHAESLRVSIGVSKKRSAKSLSSIEKLARSGLDEARRSVQALRPKALERKTLLEAVKQAAMKASQPGKFTCSFRERGIGRELSAEAQNELFRIAQEALANIVKHAKANAVSIDLTFTMRQAKLTIRDDGVGFATSGRKRSKRTYGLASMKERAQRIGAELDIESPKKGGTVVCVRLPLNKNLGFNKRKAQR